MLAAIAPAFFAQPALAYGPSSYVTDGVTDLTFPDFMEGLIQWKAVQTGVSTASESSAMTAALDVGMGSLVESAEAGAVGLAAVGTPVGWLALLGIAGGAGTYCIVEGCTSPLWSQEGTSPVTFGEPVPTGSNITAGQPLWHATGGTNQGKTITCYGSDADETVAECVAWMNSNDTTTSYTAAAANPSTNTAILTEFNKTTNQKNGQTVSITPASTGNSSYSCSSPAALTVTSSGCTYTTGDNNGSPTLPLQIGDPVTEAQQIPLQYGKASLDPGVIADVANDAWRLSAAQQGYQGLPYSTGNPITAADVQSYASTLPASAYPTVQSAVAPIAQLNPTAGQPDVAITEPSASPTSAPKVDLPSITTSGGTSQSGTSTGTSSSTTTSTGTTGSTTTTTTSTGSSNTTNVTVNTCGLPGQPACEVDWNPTGATQTTPAAPSYSDIFNLLLTFSNLSFWKSWTVTVPAGACTIFEIPYSGTNYPLDVCTPLASMQAMFQSIETAMIALTVVFILLGA